MTGPADCSITAAMLRCGNTGQWNDLAYVTLKHEGDL
jgi:hypothetical protein